MLKRAITILECSRIFSLPMTIFSWLIVFVYGWIDSGNVLYGVVALIGIIFAHLGTNLLDDYFDYKALIKRVDFDKKEYLKNSQKTKCRYLISGLIKESELALIIIIYFAVAALIGLLLFLTCGTGVIFFALAASIIMLLYPFLSKICMSEICVALAYGPVMFGGVYYVMTGTYSADVLFLSVPSMLMTVVLLYIHTVMDYDYDLNEGHKTIANRFNSQLDSLVVLKALLILSYVSAVFLCIPDIVDWQVFLTFITVPLALDLYTSLSDYSIEPDKVPEKKWYHFPMENLEFFEKRGESSFMFRMYQSRNLMMYFSLMLVLGIILSRAV